MATRSGRYLSLDNLGVRTTYLDASECTEVEGGLLRTEVIIITLLVGLLTYI